jgi:hypothetical protein
MVGGLLDPSSSWKLAAIMVNVPQASIKVAK